MGKESACMQENWVPSMGSEDGKTKKDTQSQTEREEGDMKTKCDMVS